MRLTTFTDYSLRTLIYVATAPEGRATVAEVAQAFDISENHLTKVVHTLGKAGFLANTRGRGGGLRLAVPSESINIGQVVRTTEASNTPAECFEWKGSTCPLVPVCRLKSAFRQAVNAFYDALDLYSLEDVIKNREEIITILFHPRRQARRKARGTPRRTGAAD